MHFFLFIYIFWGLYGCLHGKSTGISIYRYNPQRILVHMVIFVLLINLHIKHEHFTSSLP